MKDSTSHSSPIIHTPKRSKIIPESAVPNTNIPEDMPHFDLISHSLMIHTPKTPNNNIPETASSKLDIQYFDPDLPTTSTALQNETVYRKVIFTITNNLLHFFNFLLHIGNEPTNCTDSYSKDT